MGIIDLQGMLRSLCFNTEWNYAVFWKLKHRARMVLTWEDAYYENFEPHDLYDNKCFKKTFEDMCEGHYLHDSLGLAVAKMSYHVYSLGEGIVGQVAVTGKHEWIIVPDKHTTGSTSSFEFSDGWHSQFSAGIKTVVVVAVVPYGVVQLGSFSKVAEDGNLVARIKDIFSSLQNDKNASLLHHRSDISYLGQQNQSGINSLYDHRFFQNPIGSGSESNSNPNLNNSTKESIISSGTEHLDFQGESSHPFSKFPAGFELQEALGPPFSKGCHYLENEARNFESISTSGMTCESGSENLLEAVVGSLSYCKSEKTPNSSGGIEHTIHSINEPSVIQMDRDFVPAKSSKKRAKSGENGRPRPRDRQLIQDRFKELRELVPNGTKCSIDSLLERTIKHMIFMESITNHADKLNKCTESKMHQKALDKSNYEKGSSWAVEIGGRLKVSSIIVEDLDKNGQMLVEILCEECCHFLEISEAIRSLGLTILKGVTEKHGDKTWICFIVEGQNKRVMHRMDILWSLVQTFQPKTSSN